MVAKMTRRDVDGYTDPLAYRKNDFLATLFQWIIIFIVIGVVALACSEGCGAQQLQQPQSKVLHKHAPEVDAQMARMDCAAHLGRIKLGMQQYRELLADLDPALAKKLQVQLDRMDQEGQFEAEDWSCKRVALSNLDMILALEQLAWAQLTYDKAKMDLEMVQSELVRKGARQ